MIKCVIFDFGDTLSNAKESNKITHEQCPELPLLKQVKPKLTKEELLKIKKQTDEKYRKTDYLAQQKDRLHYTKILFKELGIKFDSHLAERCEETFWNARIENTQLLPNVKTLLQNLKKKKIILAVITNSKSGHNKQISKNHGIDKLFDEFIISSEFGSVKSELKIYTHLLEKLNKKRQNKISPKECLMVGNNLNEDTLAKKLGMKTVILTKSIAANEIAEKIEPDYYIDDLLEIENIIEKLK